MISLMVRARRDKSRLRLLNEYLRVEAEGRIEEAQRNAMAKLIAGWLIEMAGRPADASPGIAEFLLTALATSSHAEAAIGDLNERFAGECKKSGRRRAVRLYWARTLRSLWPLLRRAIGRALKWGVVIATVRRFFS